MPEDLDLSTKAEHSTHTKPDDYAFYRGSKHAHEALLKKADNRLLWFLLLCYTLSYLDRINLSNVKTPMTKDLGMSPAQYGLAASIFFVPYVIAELPSNMILVRVNPAHYIARIIFVWGIIATLLTLIEGYYTLLIIRFCLGLAEAGFFPGIIFYLTQWYSPPERARRLYWIYLGQPVAGVVGSLLAYVILENMNGTWGFAGWRWVFFLEGIPTVLVGIFTWFYLPSSPGTATWLTAEEQQFLMARMRTSNPSAHASKAEQTALLGAESSKPNCMQIIKTTWHTTFTTPMLWLALVINFCALFPVVAVSFYLPDIIKETGVGEVYGNLVSAIPFFCGSVAMYFNSVHSDKTKERFWHIMAFNGVALVGLGLTAYSLQGTKDVYLQIAALSIAAAGFWGAKPPLLAWFTSTLPGQLAASIAAITSIGNLSGVVAPSAMSAAREATDDYLLGAFLLMAVLLLYSSLLVAYNCFARRQRVSVGITPYPTH
jgi:MFS family permease